MNTIRYLEVGDSLASALVNAPLTDLEGNDLLLKDWIDENIENIEAIDARVTALEEAVPPGAPVQEVLASDDILYVWKDNGTITLQPGKAILSDGTVYEIPQAVDVDFTDLDTGSEAANSFYFIWLGVVDEVLTVKLSLSSTSPTGLNVPYRLRGGVRNNNSSNLLPFVMSQTHMDYDVDVLAGASELTQVYATTLSTSWVDINGAGFMPPGKRLAVYKYNNGGNLMYSRANGASATNGTLVYGGAGIWEEMAVDGVIECKQNASSTCYITLKRYQL